MSNSPRRSRSESGVKAAPSVWTAASIWAAVAGVLVTAVAYVLLYVGGDNTHHTTDLPPQVGGNGGIPAAAPRTVIDFGGCGRTTFVLDMPGTPFADEPFTVALLAVRDARSGGATCGFTARLDMTSANAVAVAPEGPVRMIARRGAPTNHRWTLEASSAGLFGVSVTISDEDVAAASSLHGEIQVQSSRRLYGANTWLSGLLGNEDTVIRVVTGEGALRTGRRALVTVVVSAPTRPLPPGLSSDVTLEVCLEATGGGTSSRYCSTGSVDVSAPLRVERHLPLEIASTEVITIAAELRLTGVVDGVPTGATVRSWAVPLPVRATETLGDRVRDAGSLALKVVGVMGGAAGIAVMLAGGRQVWVRLRKLRRRREAEPAAAPEEHTNAYP
jgi:hypothetical protein